MAEACRLATGLSEPVHSLVAASCTNLNLPPMLRDPQHNFSRTTAGESFDRAGWLILAGLTALAAAMRFYRLGSVPAGLHYDEAFNALDALSLLDTPLTDWPVFFNGNYGREPLFIWLTATVLALVGPSIWTARFISALSGVILIPAMAWLGWHLAPALDVRRRKLFALWCAAAFLALLWSQIFARYGIRANLFVLVSTALWAALWRAWQNESARFHAWTLAGLLLGLSLYTYLPARLFPFVLLLLLGAAYFQERPCLLRHLPGLLCCSFAALLFAAPILIYFMQNPQAFNTRLTQVTTGIGWGDLPAHLVDVLGMFILSGDHNPVSNLPSRPVLDLFLAPAFLIGLGASLHRFWTLGRLFLLVGLIVSLLPTILTENAPNFIRAIGALPFTVLFVAYGAERAVSLAGQLTRGRWLRPALVSVWTLFAFGSALTAWTYFEVWRSSPVMFYAWSNGFVEMTRRIEAGNEARVYISPRDPSHPHPDADPHPSGKFLHKIKGVAPQYHDERFCIRLALTAPARYFSLAEGEDSRRLRPETYFPDAAAPRLVIFDDSDRQWATEFETAKDPNIFFPGMRSYNVELADGISLSGFQLSPDTLQAEKPFNVRLYWRVKHTPSEDYTLFLHLLHAEDDGILERFAGFDLPPGNGSCPMTEWLPEEMVIHDVEAIAPASLPPGEIFLAVGFYTPSDGQRMPVSLASDDHVLIGPLVRSP